MESGVADNSGYRDTNMESTNNFQAQNGRGRLDQVGDIADDNFSVRNQIGEFSEALVSTRNDFKSMSKMVEVEKLSQNCRLATLQSQVDKLSQSLRYVETQLPHLWRGVQKDGQENEAADLLAKETQERTYAVQRLEHRCNEICGMLTGDAQQHGAWETNLQTLNANWDAGQIQQSNLEELAQQAAASMQILEDKFETESSERKGLEGRCNELATMLKLQSEKLDAERSERSEEILALRQACQAGEAGSAPDRGRLKVAPAGGPSKADLAEMRASIEEIRSGIKHASNGDFEALRAFIDPKRMAGSPARDPTRGNFDELRSSIDEMKKGVTSLDLEELRGSIADIKKDHREFSTMKLTWNTAHTTLKHDMRELMVRFNEATPLQLSSQLQELRRDLNAVTNKVALSPQSTPLQGTRPPLVGQLDDHEVGKHNLYKSQASSEGVSLEGVLSGERPRSPMLPHRCLTPQGERPTVPILPQHRLMPQVSLETTALTAGMSTLNTASLSRPRSVPRSPSSPLLRSPGSAALPNFYQQQVGASTTTTTLSGAQFRRLTPTR